MQEIDKIILAWKDEEFRMSLSADERQALPENPAGLLDLSNTNLKGAARVTYTPSFFLFFGACF